MRTFRWMLSALLAIAGSAAAQDPPQAIVLQAAHLFDGKSGTLVSPGRVLVRGKTIEAVGDFAVPAGAKVVDLGDATLVPGFIDAHTHMVSDYDASWTRGFYNSMMRLPVEQAYHAEHNAHVTLQAGVTTIREVGAGDYIDVALRNAIEQGLAEGPRMLVSVHAIGSTGGHCDGPAFPTGLVREFGEKDGVCNGADSCRRAVREQLKYGADNIKVCASGGVLSETDPVDVPQLTPDELRAIVDEAHAWRRKVAAHAHGDRAARMAVDAGVDSIEHGSFLTTETLQRMKDKGVYLVPTRMTVKFVLKQADTYPPHVAKKAREAAASHGEMMKNALRIGTPIAYGTDAVVYPHGINAQEFGDYVELGMSPAQALMTSSLGSARLLGIDKETGTLEAGKFADIVAVPGDVLQDVRATERVVFVMKQGKVVREK
ncbi:Amidohydrolase [Lysobacter dokdonensis DS-58]|uniref:Amidohydrolase n=1 Tax=Lysobacter dokdonensis DS-58 TaxID=1300345 RepID=A0A0A2WCY8_9GAMM|nr:amidohydrolase family protein [Lysobacter dokdonensis]KGQ18011.1 Amidohydrolase [Lysobacter dokdonensis DS-58]